MKGQSKSSNKKAAKTKATTSASEHLNYLVLHLRPTKRVRDQIPGEQTSKAYLDPTAISRQADQALRSFGFPPAKYFDTYIGRALVYHAKLALSPTVKKAMKQLLDSLEKIATGFDVILDRNYIEAGSDAKVKSYHPIGKADLGDRESVKIIGPKALGRASSALKRVSEVCGKCRARKKLQYGDFLTGTPKSLGTKCNHETKKRRR